MPDLQQARCERKKAVPDMRNNHEGKEISLTLPMFVVIPRKRTADKRFWVNLNVYRNAHYQVLDDAKKLYAGEVMAALAASGARTGSRLASPVEMDYVIYAKDRRTFDIGNVLSIVQKFTEDALVSLKILEEDDYNHVYRVTHTFGGIDRDRPRVELRIRETHDPEREARLASEGKVAKARAGARRSGPR